MFVIDRPETRQRQRRWRNQNGLLVPTSEAVAEALATIPDEAPWTWAALRVLPAIRGRRVQVIEDGELEKMGFRPSSAFPTLHCAPGIDVTLVIEVDVICVTIDQQQLDRWEMTLEQVVPAAMANLRRAVGTWRGSVREEINEGVHVRTLDGWPHWATGLLLVPDELQRLFGPHDQLFIAPYSCNLISLPIDVERDYAADLVDLFGIVNPRSLLLGMPAFALRGGELSIEELPGFPEDPADEWAQPSR
jgi:hypothetical protein